MSIQSLARRGGEYDASFAFPMTWKKFMGWTWSIIQPTMRLSNCRDRFRREKVGDHFIVRTVVGETYRSKAITLASGSCRTPYTPTISEQALYRGTSLHSSEYRNPMPFIN